MSICRSLAVFVFGVTTLAWAGPQDKASAGIKYVFRKGDVLKYDVTQDLATDLTGSDACFLTGGAKIFHMSLRGEFDNIVKNVNDTDGSGTMDRKINSLHISGDSKGNKFKMDWERAKAKDFKVEELDPISQFYYPLTQTPVEFTVSPVGTLTVADAAYARLGMKYGMSYWGLEGEKGSKAGEWILTEELAVPGIHDHIFMECRNELGRTTNKGGRKILQISCKVSGLKKKVTAAEAASQEGFNSLEVDYKPEGTVTVDIESATGKLVEVAIDIRITGTGMASGPDGKPASLKIVASLKETMTLKE